MSKDVQKNDESENGNLAQVEKQLTEIDPKIFEGIPKQKKQQIIKSLVVTMHKTHIGRGCSQNCVKVVI